MVFKSLSWLAPQYLCDLFTKNSYCSYHSLGNADGRLPNQRILNVKISLLYMSQVLERLFHLVEAGNLPPHSVNCHT